MAMRILIVDDEVRIRSSLRGLLKDEGYAVEECESGEGSVERLQGKGFDVVLLDVVLPGMDGLETLEHIRRIAPRTRVLMMSGRSDLSTAVRATKLGASNFFEKPLNPDQVLMELKSIADQMTLEQRVASLENLVDREEEIIGDSPVLRRLREAIARAAPSEGRVLIFGENGTGKELVARAIHRVSDRRHRPFVSLNCAAIPKDLVESELFGYEKGAFTGAVRRKSGRFEVADGGTLFLDEVGDMGLETQAKLLRVLQENEALRLGGDTPYTFDVRIITATNKNLTEEIKGDRFREDLFYRLNVIPLEIPPLRERREDIPVLSHHFLRKICEKTGKGMKEWGKEALEVLGTYGWPGNVRELRNFVERLVIMSEGRVIEVKEVVEALPVRFPPSLERSVRCEEEGLPLRKMVERFERGVLVQGYREVGGNVSKLARKLKTDRANLHRKLKSYGIK